MQRQMHATNLSGPDPETVEAGYAGAWSHADAHPPFACGRYGCDNAVQVCDAIVDLLAAFFNVSGRQLRSAKRAAPNVSRIRQIGMYVAHVTLRMRMTHVGIGFGRDKSTVVHACHTIEDLREDEDFDLIVARVEKLVAVAFSLERAREGRDD